MTVEPKTRGLMVERTATGLPASCLGKELLAWAFSGADDGIRTRDPHLGKTKATDRARLSYLRLCRLMQRDRGFRMTTMNRD